MQNVHEWVRVDYSVIASLVNLSELAGVPYFRLKDFGIFIENYQYAYVCAYVFTYNIKH